MTCSEYITNLPLHIERGEKENAIQINTTIYSQKKVKVIVESILILYTYIYICVCVFVSMCIVCVYKRAIMYTLHTCILLDLLIAVE